MRAGVLALIAAGVLSACSPVYVAKSAAGHLGFLARRKSIKSLLKDPKVPEAEKAKLRIIAAAREFGFEKMGLERTRDFSTVSKVRGKHLAILVIACERTAFKPYLWWFPVIGRFPYKGFFKRKDAERERKRLEDRGYDVTLGGIGAYNTPLWFSDPLPSTALKLPDGELAGLILHELSHGTVDFKDQAGFNESLATFVGNQGALEFIETRFGADDKRLSDLRRSIRNEKLYSGVMEEVYATLKVLYASDATEAEKLELRETTFAWGEKRFDDLDLLGSAHLNNAVILSHQIYYEDQERFGAVYERMGRDWGKALAVFKSLDRKDPGGDLAGRLETGPLERE